MGARGIPTRLRHLLPGFVDFTVGFLAGVSRCSNQITYGRSGPRQPRIVLGPDSESLHQATYVCHAHIDAECNFHVGSTGFDKNGLA